MRGGALASSAPGNFRLSADVDLSTKERTGGYHHTGSSESTAFQRFDAEHSRVVAGKDQAGDSSLNRLHELVLLQQRSDRAAIQPTIALGTRRPYRGSL